MWIRKQPSEVRLEKGFKVLRIMTLLDVVCLTICYLLARHSGVFGLPNGDLPVVCAGIALTAIFAVSWRLVLRSRKRRWNGMVCDRCNLLKSDDGEAACRCGGSYFPLAEMKWVPKQTVAAPFPAAGDNRPFAQDSQKITTG